MSPGNPNLEPESAVSFNMGAIFEWENLFGGGASLYISLDYWNFSLEDPIIREDFNSLVRVGFGDPALASGGSGTLIVDGPLADRFQISQCDPHGCLHLHRQQHSAHPHEHDQRSGHGHGRH